MMQPDASHQHRRAYPFESLDPYALNVVHTLQSAGYIAYFVGGCVRDLELGRTPKDFDIATDATPEQLAAVFGRRCRIIGRRFRLGHIRAGSNVYEVATFRGTPQDQEADNESGFVVRANTFGSPEEDARSRDFTCNGLFYDPSSETLLDYVGGLADIERRRIVTIGNAAERFAEDPVRLVRAIRFAAKLSLDLSPDIIEAAPETVGLIAQCPMARVSEELFRLFEGGFATSSLEQLDRLEVLEALLPHLGAIYASAPDYLRQWLEAFDRIVKAHGTLPRASTFCLIAWPVIEQCLETHHFERSDLGSQLFEDIRTVSISLNIPVKHRHRLRGMLNFHGRMADASRRRSLGHHQLKSPSLPLALTLTRMRFEVGRASEAELTDYEAWSQQLESLGLCSAPFESRPADEPPRVPQVHGSPTNPRPRKRRPRRRGPKLQK